MQINNNPMVKIIGRLRYFLSPSNKSYRKVILARVLLAVLKKFQPKLAFIGLKDESDNVLFHYDDKAITLYSLAKGYFHRHEVVEVLDLIKKHSSLNGGLAVEIGGNIGSSTITLAKNFKRVICFEPDPKNVELLKANIAINGLQRSVSVVEAAVSNQAGFCRLSISPLNYGDNRVANNNKASHPESLEVMCCTLSQHLQEIGIEPADIDFLWCDTQGHEGFVLEGSELILAARKSVWIVEYWPEGMKSSGCYDMFHTMVQKHFSKAIDIKSGKSYAPSEIESVNKDLKRFSEFTDFLLIP